MTIWGRSAAGGVARVGFERMIAEVCLGKVSAVAAREEEIDCVEAVWLCLGSHLLAPQAGKNFRAVNSRVRPCRTTSPPV